MITIYPKLIHDALATVRYPGNGKNLVEAEMVADKTSSRRRWWPTICASTA